MYLRDEHGRIRRKDHMMKLGDSGNAHMPCNSFYWESVVTRRKSRVIYSVFSVYYLPESLLEKQIVLSTHPVHFIHARDTVESKKPELWLCPLSIKGLSSILRFSKPPNMHTKPPEARITTRGSFPTHALTTLRSARRVCRKAGQRPSETFSHIHAQIIALASTPITDHLRRSSSMPETQASRRHAWR